MKQAGCQVAAVVVGARPQRRFFSSYSIPGHGQQNKGMMYAPLFAYEFDAVTALSTLAGTVVTAFIAWLTWKAMTAQRQIEAKKRSDDHDKAMIDKGKRIASQEAEEKKEREDREKIAVDLQSLQKKLNDQTEAITKKVSESMIAARNGEYSTIRDAVARMDSNLAEMRQAFDEHVIEDRQQFEKLLAK